VRIEVYGGAEARAVFRAFTARHHGFKITQAKKWGVALLPLPDLEDAYLGSVSRQVRRARAKAINAGYRYCLVDPRSRIDEILAINESAPTRQGRRMDEAYVRREEVISTIGARESMHGILDRDGVLRAYGHVLDIGDAFTFTFLIGHADSLADGVMYLLMDGIVRWCVAARRSDRTPRWLMADTFWGASAGLANFKERAGFRPTTVEWVWVDGPAGSK
jgi:hypothetical protein